MKDYNTSTDWMRNKNSASIIYKSADGSVTEITLEDFLAESAENTEEIFRQIKEASDKLFHSEDIAEARNSRNELSLFDFSEQYASKPLEEQIVCLKDRETEQIYLKKRNQMLKLVPEILDKLTETQRRRFLLHKVKGFTVRKIAKAEGVAHQSVFESIIGAEKKIEKFLRKFSQNNQKHPDKTDD